MARMQGAVITTSRLVWMSHDTSERICPLKMDISDDYCWPYPGRSGSRIFGNSARPLANWWWHYPARLYCSSFSICIWCLMQKKIYPSHWRSKLLWRRLFSEYYIVRTSCRRSSSNIWSERRNSQLAWIYSSLKNRRSW